MAERETTLKIICAVIALSAGSSVAMADYILDTMTGGAFSYAVGSNGHTGNLTSPTNSTVPGSMGFRVANVYTGGGSDFATLDLGGGQLSMTWTLGSPANGIASAGAETYHYFSGGSLGSMTTLSVSGFGSMSPNHSVADITVSVHDSANRLATWWVTITPGTFSGWQVDLTSAPGFADPGFNPSSINDLNIRYGFMIFGNGMAQGGGGSFTVTEMSFIPTPGAAALLGLGGLAAVRRRR